MNDEIVHGEHMAVFHDEDDIIEKVTISYDGGRVFHTLPEYKDTLLSRIKRWLWRLFGRKN